MKKNHSDDDDEDVHNNNNNKKQQKQWIRIFHAQIKPLQPKQIADQNRK